VHSSLFLAQWGIVFCLGPPGDGKFDIDARRAESGE
jgi:hypothetical protein